MVSFSRSPVQSVVTAFGCPEPQSPSQSISLHSKHANSADAKIRQKLNCRGHKPSGAELHSPQLYALCIYPDTHSPEGVIQSF